MSSRKVFKCNMCGKEADANFVPTQNPFELSMCAVQPQPSLVSSWFHLEFAIMGLHSRDLCSLECLTSLVQAMNDKKAQS